MLGVNRGQQEVAGGQGIVVMANATGLRSRELELSHHA